MGRDRNPVVEHFVRNGTKFICQIESCGTEMAINTNSTYNLERHVQRYHEKEASLLLQKKNCLKRTACDEQPKIEDIVSCLKTIKIQLSEKDIIDACVELVTKNGRPFSLIEDSGFRKIIDPVLKAMKCHTAVTSESIRNRVNEVAKDLRLKVSKEVKGKMISLKVDSATRFDRSILGINIQYILHGEIVLRTLAMRELNQRHTGDYLKSVIITTLTEFGIDVDQLYTITSDNGANMLKAIKLIQDDIIINDTELGDNDYDNDYLMEDINSEQLHNPILWDSEQSDENKPEEFDDVNTIPEILIDQKNAILKSVRCAAHTMQLAVFKILKERTTSHKISNCRELSKKLRTPTIMLLIKTLKLNRPIIDCPTRWNSTYDMLLRLLEFREFCAESCSTYSFLKVPITMWDFMEAFTKVFAPIKSATLQLQTDQLTIGDFVGIWLKAKLEISNISHISMAKQLHIALLDREAALFDNVAVSAALYLDPRFKSLLPLPKVECARKHLLETWKLIKTFQPVKEDICIAAPEPFNPHSQSQASTNSKDEIDIDAYLNRCDELSIITQRSPDNHEQHIKSLINDFIMEPRLMSSTNILTFWENRKNDPLFELACVVLAVPACQVSVERNFSMLKFILTHLRCRLNPSVLEDILFIKLNNFK